MGRDRNRPHYLRALATNCLLTGRQSADIDWLRQQIKSEYDPELLRAYAVALWRISQLDGGSAARVATRSVALSQTISFLKSASKVPSLIPDEELPIRA